MRGVKDIFVYGFNPARKRFIETCTEDLNES